jgi:hypothetical protein
LRLQAPNRRRRFWSGRTGYRHNVTIPNDPTPIEPEPAPLEPDGPGGPGGPGEPFDAEEAEVLHTLENDLPGQPSYS